MTAIVAGTTQSSSPGIGRIDKPFDDVRSVFRQKVERAKVAAVDGTTVLQHQCFASLRLLPLCTACSPELIEEGKGREVAEAFDVLLTVAPGLVRPDVRQFMNERLGET